MQIRRVVHHATCIDEIFQRRIKDGCENMLYDGDQQHYSPSFSILEQKMTKIFIENVRIRFNLTICKL